MENRFCAAEGESGDAASVGLASGLPALASSSSDNTCAGKACLQHAVMVRTQLSELLLATYQALRFCHGQPLQEQVVKFQFADRKASLAAVSMRRTYKASTELSSHA